MENECARWLEIARTDLGVAEHLFQTFYPKPLEIICYHCQQAAEKAIKAVILATGAEGGLPRLHDLSFLLDQIKNKITIDEKLYDFADTLTPYGISIRYPSELFLEERHAKDAVQIAGQVVEWANDIIKTFDSN